MLILLSRLFSLAAVGLLVCAGVLFFVSRYDAPASEALVVEEPERDVGELTTGAHIVTFRVRNTTQLPQRIVGMTEN